MTTLRFVEVGTLEATAPRPGLAIRALHAARTAPTVTRLHWLFRIAVCWEFVGHGAFGIIGKEAWLPYFGAFGISDGLAWDLMPLVGAVDIALGLISLVRPMAAVLLHMTFWGLMTASLRPLTDEPIWELFERGGNYAVPLAFLILVGGGGRSVSGWIARATPALTVTRAVAMAWSLRIGTALLLVGHGGFGAFMNKDEWVGYFAQVGIGAGTVESAHLLALVGWFEIAVGLAILCRPLRGLLVFAVAWKIGTEALRPLAGEPTWEFVERGGSYAAPLALIWVQGWLRRHRPVRASAGARPAGAIAERSLSAIG